MPGFVAMMGKRKGLLLTAWLLLAVAANAQVVNLGYPGANSAELAERFASALALHPTIVIMMAGANDALNPAKFLPPETSRQQLQAMADQAQAAGAQLTLVTVHDPDYAQILARHSPADYGVTPPQKRLQAMDEVIRQVAAKNGLTLVDFQAVMKDAGGPSAQLSTDGLHLTRNGYGLLAAAVRARLPARVSSSATIVCFGDSLTYGIGVRAAGGATENADTYPAQLRELLKR